MAVIKNIFAITALLTTALPAHASLLKRAYSGVATFNNYAAQGK
jgi:hypothetical protein